MKDEEKVAVAGNRKQRRNSAKRDMPEQIHSQELAVRKRRKVAFEAALEGSVLKLRRFVRTEEEANWTDEGKPWCLLDAAVRAGALDAVEWLLNKGADANTWFSPAEFADKSEPLDDWGFCFSPLAKAVNQGSCEIAGLLIFRGASLDLPVWINDDGVVTTVRDKARWRGMLTAITAIAEAYELKNTTPEAPCQPARRL